MDLQLTSITNSFGSREAAAQFATARRLRDALPSIITIEPVESGGYSVTIATMVLASSETV